MPQRLSRVQIVMILVFIGAAIYFGFRVFANKDDGKLRASGTIEAVEVNVSPETSGKVKDILVDEGQSVRKGDALLVLDDSLLTAQQQVSQSGVDSAHSALLTAQSSYNLAQAQYNASLTAARAQEGAQRLTDWTNRAPGLFNQPLWYFNQEEQITSAETEVDSANQALQQARTDLKNIVEDLSNARFVAAETRLANARTNYLITKTVNDHAQVTGGKVSPEDVTGGPAQVRPCLSYQNSYCQNPQRRQRHS